MSNFRILHTADWHVCTEFLPDAQACLGFMIDHVAALDTALDLIVIPGDIYNHRQIQQETEAARLALKAIQNLSYHAPVVIMTGTPSHDGKAPLMLDNIGSKFPVLVVDQPSQWVLYAKEIDGLEFVYFFRQIQDLDQFEDDATIAKAVISCTPAFTKQHFETGSDIATSDGEIADALGAIFADFGANVASFQREELRYKRQAAPVPHILLGHYAIGGASIHPEQAKNIGKDIEISRDHIDLAKADINCLGHIHAFQQVGDNTWYSGSLFSTDFGEIEVKGFLIHDLELSDLGRFWEPAATFQVKTPSPVLVKINIDFVLNPIDELLQDAIENPNNDLLLQRILITATKIETDADDSWNTIVRMEIKIYQDEAGLIDEDAVKEYFGDLGLRSFRLDIVRMPRPNVRSARIMEADRLVDKIKFRAEIVNHELDDGILDKAELLQEATEDGLQEMVNFHIDKEMKSNEKSVD